MTTLNPLLSDIINHARNREYMSGIDRNHTRVKATQEVFTPTPLVQEVLDRLPQELFTDPTKTFMDPSCGDGQFLSEVLIRKLENGIDFETALRSIHGVDIMIDNIDLCRNRLLCGHENLRHIVEQNIVCENSLTYNYSFKRPTKKDKEREEELRKKQMFDQLFEDESNKKKLEKKSTTKKATAKKNKKSKDEIILCT